MSQKDCFVNSLIEQLLISAMASISGLGQSQFGTIGAVGAVGAAVPTDFEEGSFCTLYFHTKSL